MQWNVYSEQKTYQRIRLSCISDCLLNICCRSIGTKFANIDATMIIRLTNVRSYNTIFISVCLLFLLVIFRIEFRRLFFKSFTALIYHESSAFANAWRNVEAIACVTQPVCSGKNIFVKFIESIYMSSPCFKKLCKSWKILKKRCARRTPRFISQSHIRFCIDAFVLKHFT